MKKYFYKFSVLLPIKIEGGELISSQSQTLIALADTIDPNDLSHQVVVYLGIDEEEVSSKALMDIQRIFSSKNMSTTLTTFKKEDSGRICFYWRSLADKAVEDGSDFFVLLGDDTIIHQKTWTLSIIEDFKSMHSSRNLPPELFGFGTIAIVDHQSYGFPTFPVLHRIHYEMNNGQLFDGCFINQDADPFLFIPSVFGFRAWFQVSLALVLTDVLMDIYAIYPDTSKEGSCKGLIRLLACMESCLIKNINCFGRFSGHIQRGNLHDFCLRFDWFCGLDKNVVIGEKV
jgi:hypothetical protein